MTSISTGSFAGGGQFNYLIHGIRFCTSGFGATRDRGKYDDARSGENYRVALNGGSWPFSADHGYKACWSDAMQSVVRTNANDWSGRMQTSGQVECNFAIKGTLQGLGPAEALN